MARDRTALEDVLDLDRVLRRRLRRDSPGLWQRIDLPIAALRALLIIEDDGESSPGAVAQTLGIPRATVTSLLDRLEAAGLIERQLNPADRRSFRLSPTDRGRVLAYQLDGHRRELLGRALRRMRPDAMGTLRDGLRALLAAVEAETADDEAIDTSADADAPAGVGMTQP